MNLPMQAQPVIRGNGVATRLAMPTKGIIASECDWECGTGTAAALAACTLGGVATPAAVLCFAGLIAAGTTQSCRGCIEAYWEAYVEAAGNIPRGPGGQPN